MLKSLSFAVFPYLSTIMPYYAVIGPKAGVFNTWDEAKACTHGVSGARCKKFATAEEAKNYVQSFSAETTRYEPTAEKRKAAQILSKNKSYYYKPLAVGKKVDSNSPSKSSVGCDAVTIDETSNASSNESVTVLADVKSESDNTCLKRSSSPVDTLGKAFNRVAKKSKVNASGSNLSEDLGNKGDSNCNGTESSNCGRVEDLWGDEDVFSAVPEDLLTGDAGKSSENKTKQSSKATKSKLNRLGSGLNFVYDDSGSVVVFTDGACSKNGQLGAQAGIGVWFNHNHPFAEVLLKSPEGKQFYRAKKNAVNAMCYLDCFCSTSGLYSYTEFLFNRNLAEPVQGSATNNNAEIQAATRAIQQANKAGVSKLNINTDSQFLIECITVWIHSWKKNNWQLSSGKPVKNKEQLVLLDKTMKTIASVSWTHVRGHTGNVGNEAADRLARQGALMYRFSQSYNNSKN